MGGRCGIRVGGEFGKGVYVFLFVDQSLFVIIMDKFWVLMELG